MGYISADRKKGFQDVSRCFSPLPLHFVQRIVNGYESFSFSAGMWARIVFEGCQLWAAGVACDSVPSGLLPLG